MSNHQAEERALEVMRKELAAERGPDLPWNDMERELMARLDEAPMTSHPRSLDARVEDVPIASVRNPRAKFVQISFAVLAAAAVFLLFWVSPLHSGKPIIIKTATPAATPPDAPSVQVEQGPPSSSPTNSTAPKENASATVAPPIRTITTKDVRSVFKTCLALDKRYGAAAAQKLKGDKLTVFLEKDGHIKNIRFDSPVEPTVMQCFFDKLHTGQFVGTNRPITLKF